MRPSGPAASQAVGPYDQADQGIVSAFWAQLGGEVLSNQRGTSDF